MTKINLKKNIILSGSYRLIILVIMFISSWISARYLGVELKGKYSYFVTITGFLWMVLDFGIYRSYPYFIRKNPEKKEALLTWSLYQFIAESFILLIIGFVFIRSLGSMMSYPFTGLYLILFVLLITASQYSMQLQGVLLGTDQIFDHSVSQLISSLFVMVFILVGYFVFTGIDKLAYSLGILLLSTLLMVIYDLSRLSKIRLFAKPDLKFLAEVYRSGFRVFCSSLLIMLLLRFDVIMVKHFLGYTDVGIYSIAAHIIDLLQFASNVVGGLLLVKLTDSEDMEYKWGIMRKLTLAFSIVLGIANLGFLLLGKFLLGFFFGKSFVPVYYAYLWLIPAGFFLSFGSLFNNYLNSKGFPLISILFPAIALLTNISINYILIPVLGIAGAAISTSISYAIWFISIVYYEQRVTKGRLIHFLIPQKSDFIELYSYGVSLVPKKLKRNR